MPLREETGRRLATHLPAPNPPHLVTHAATTHPVPRYALSLPQPTPLHPSRHRLTVSLVGRREGTGLLTSLPSLCFGPSVHASGRQGQGPARFLVPLVNRGPVARRASSVGTAHSVHSPAPGGGRNERSEERAVILPSHHGPSPSLPAEPGECKEVTPFTHFLRPFRSGVSLPPLRPSLYSLVHLGPRFFACHVIPATDILTNGGTRRGTE